MGSNSLPESIDSAALSLTSGTAPTPEPESLASLLSHIDDLGAACGIEQKSSPAESKLIQVRLGMASSLFAALRAKHPPTALHCLRVAIGCSSWATALQMSPEQLDDMEVAALLHDVGKISVPDNVLCKPHKLTAEDYVAMERHVDWGVDILGHCCASRDIVDIVRYTPAWFDGSRYGFDRAGNGIPQGARMLAIVDAFDAMTTDQLYRKALSRDRALAELFEFAGTQFDPELVRSFVELSSQNQVRMHAAVARRWLGSLSPEKSNAGWRLSTPPQISSPIEGESLFHQQLLNSMHDAVIFVDPNLRIIRWNRAAEQLTGVKSSTVLQRKWSPSLLEVLDAEGNRISDDACPLAASIARQEQAAMRVTINGRDDLKVVVDMQMAPVIARDGVAQGAAVLLHDATSRLSMEERLQSLHDKAARDPLTQLANRAEFDRTLEEFVTDHLKRQEPCALIICDIDRFKRINDTYGHQAGDEAILSFANLLKRNWRPGDLVARYGGEEFCMLCADCNNAQATERAEHIREELEQLEQSMLNGERITASFGVTELQAGDTPETILRRSDRALLQAKESGRNNVMQLGGGLSTYELKESRQNWLTWFTSSEPAQVLERTLMTPVPMKLAVEKLRGFVADHHADVVTIEYDYVALKLDGRELPQANRRNQDRNSPFLVEMRFKEVESADVHGVQRVNKRTQIAVSIRPVRNRDRRRSDIIERAKRVLASVSSYLMAKEMPKES